MVLFFDGRLQFRASSLSTWLAIAFLSFTYPKALATSIPTNQGFPSIVTVLTFPNSGLLKIIISFIFIPAFLGIALFSVGRETVKAYCLSCSNHYPCHVKESFFVFSSGFGGDYR